MKLTSVVLIALILIKIYVRRDVLMLTGRWVMNDFT